MSNMKKIVLITGCSSGFGYLTALTLARNGYITKASLRDINSDKAKELQKTATHENLPLEIVQIDVTDENSINKTYEYLQNKNELPDVLINNAGYGYLGTVEDAPLDEVKNQYETNVYGALRMIKKFVPHMREQQKGLIINISSVAGIAPFPLYGIYSSSKFALESLAETLNFELDQFGINVVLIEPGSFSTNFGKNRLHSVTHTHSAYVKLEKTFFERLEHSNNKLIPGQNPQEVANLILRVIESKSPKLRYLIGKDAHLYAFLKRHIPYSLWKLLLNIAYRK